MEARTFQAVVMGAGSRDRLWKGRDGASWGTGGQPLGGREQTLRMYYTAWVTEATVMNLFTEFAFK